jgi:hypothetical protein
MAFQRVREREEERNKAIKYECGGASRAIKVNIVCHLYKWDCEGITKHPAHTNTHTNRCFDHHLSCVCVCVGEGEITQCIINEGREREEWETL